MKFAVASIAVMSSALLGGCAVYPDGTPAYGGGYPATYDPGYGYYGYPGPVVQSGVYIGGGSYYGGPARVTGTTVPATGTGRPRRLAEPAAGWRSRRHATTAVGHRSRRAEAEITAGRRPRRRRRLEVAGRPHRRRSADRRPRAPPSCRSRTSARRAGRRSGKILGDTADNDRPAYRPR